MPKNRCTNGLPIRRVWQLVIAMANALIFMGRLARCADARLCAPILSVRFLTPSAMTPYPETKPAVSRPAAWSRSLCSIGRWTRAWTPDMYFDAAGPVAGPGFPAGPLRSSPAGLLAPAERVSSIATILVRTFHGLGCGRPGTRESGGLADAMSRVGMGRHCSSCLSVCSLRDFSGRRLRDNIPFLEAEAQLVNGQGSVRPRRTVPPPPIPAACTSRSREGSLGDQRRDFLLVHAGLQGDVHPVLAGPRGLTPQSGASAGQGYRQRGSVSFRGKTTISCRSGTMTNLNLLWFCPES